MSQPRKLAVCIGINDYPNTGSDLNGCENDARDWAAELGARGFEVELLLNKRATGQAIRSRLEKLASTARSGELVVVTFSGHGSFVPDLDKDEPDGTDECWCPYDVARNGPITDDELHRIHSSRATGVRWVVISDSCHSGTMTRFSTVEAPPTIAGVPHPPKRLVRFLPPGAFDPELERTAKLRGGDKRHVASRPGRRTGLLLGGCQDVEYSFDAWFDGRPNGAFTFAALRALRELPAGVTYEEWFARIRAVLPSQQYPQTPSLNGHQSMRRWRVFETEHQEAEERADGGTWRDVPGDRAASYESGARHAERVLGEIARERSESVVPRSGGAPKRTLIAEGDSWFDYPGSDILDCLEHRYGYEVESVARAGDRVEDMAYSDGQLRKFIRLVERLADREVKPHAILLSGGGNDVAGEELAMLLNHALSQRPGLSTAMLDVVVNERLRHAYEHIIDGISAVCSHRLGRRVPIVLHGYANAVPDGRGFLGGWGPLPGPWLEPSFRRKGFAESPTTRAMVAQLIGKLNDMLASLAKQGKRDHVHYVDLRPALQSGQNYKQDWANELHPTPSGFAAVAQVIAGKLSTL